MMKLLYSLCIFLLTIQLVIGQEHIPLISSYFINGALYNPAQIGETNALTGNIIYRTQWVDMPGAPTTRAILLNTPLKKENVALGINLVNDEIGATQRTALSANYAYRIILPKGKVSLGLKAKAVLQNSRWNDLLLDEQGDAEFTTNSNYLYPNFGLGVFYNTQKFYIGLSMPDLLYYRFSGGLGNLIQPSFKPANNNFIFNIGKMININKNFELQLSSLTKYVKNSPIQSDFTTVLNINDIFSVGTTYRPGIAMVGLFGYKWNYKLHIYYFYDHSINEISSFSSGSHEISVSYQFQTRLKASSPKIF